jgi:hypothetical protein
VSACGGCVNRLELLEVRLGELLIAEGYTDGREAYVPLSLLLPYLQRGGLRVRRRKRRVLIELTGGKEPPPSPRLSPGPTQASKSPGDASG